MDSDESSHWINLRKRCRFGNFILTGKTGEKKSNFAEELKILFKVDVSTEDPMIYLELLCNKHNTLLHGAKQNLGKGNVFSTEQKLFKFQEHLDSKCKVCGVE